MIGLELLLGHLVGDYIVQNDWMAANKVNTWHGEPPDWKRLPDGSVIFGNCQETFQELNAWKYARRQWYLGHLACTVHCLLYTLAVAAFTFWWMPWWGYLACFLIHWPIDRFRLAKLWMTKVSLQEKFATGPLSPWSIILVDNIWHLLTLYGIARFAWL
jgi:hypothetical protein